jgi:hypothetical protein
MATRTITGAIPPTDLDERPGGRFQESLAPRDDEIADWARQQVHQEWTVIIRKIWRRARARSLDRGLRLSLPYFDDEAMEVRQREVEVIPRGRIMFVPAFVVLAARREKELVAAEGGMSEETKQHLLGLLGILEREFGAPEADNNGPIARG